MDLKATFDTANPLVGMVHLPALPGTPGFESRERVRERALADARALAEGGVDGLLVENFGDAPFYPDDVPKHVVAEMTAVAAEIRRTVDLPLGVNVLRNDAAAAVSVAAAVDAAFVRVNCHAGAQVTDQGVLTGRAHETMRLRERVDADVAVLADVAVKHAAPLADRPFDDQFRETVRRGLADAVVVSGPATGEATPADRLRQAGELGAELGVPTFAGSGVTAADLAEVFDRVDGAIVGTALKERGGTDAPVDADRVRDLVAAAEEAR